MSNIISKDGKLIGFEPDLKEFILEDLKFYIDYPNWDEAKDMIEILSDLSKWEGYPELLEIDSGNGMGYTIREYKKEEDNE